LIGKVGRWFIQKFYYEPVFKTLCYSCGNDLKIDIRIPQVSDNLQINIGKNVTLSGVNSFFSPAVYGNPQLIIGDNSYIGFQVAISVGERVTIGKNCLTAARVMIMDNNNHPIDPDRRLKKEKITPEEIVPVIIEDNVWIGYQAYIGAGVRIGTGSIIGANSVVIKDVPPKVVVSGNPAKVVRRL
jgi:acetyltransferase-like isoleucine patch superfamily enzyme